MGGGETYRKALPTADKLYITHVHTAIEDADTFFPVIDPVIWEEESATPVATDPETGYTYEFKVYKDDFRSLRQARRSFDRSLSLSKHRSVNST